MCRTGIKCGFTLIEMLVVMAVVALLLSISAPRYFASLERSKEAALIQNLKALREGIDMFYSDQGRYPETLEELVQKRYFRALPVDPITESEKTWLTVPPADMGQRGIADVKSGAPGATSGGTAYEQL